MGFVHIHPFRGGNGRLVRLLSNLPVLRSGHLPVVIDVRDRKAYIDILAEHHIAAGQLTRDTGVWPDEALDASFKAFCRQSYRVTRALIEQARAQQAKRAK